MKSKFALLMILTMLMSLISLNVYGATDGSADSASAARNIRIGLQNQPTGDIVITESGKGVWDAKTDGSKYIDLILPNGFKWDTLPTVTVSKGDLTLITSNIKDVTDTTLRIPIKYSSTVASQLILTNGTVSVDRTVPEGILKVKVGGTALIANYVPSGTNGGFDTDTVGSILMFNVITPADTNPKASGKSIFTVGSKEWIRDDTPLTLDVAPYISAQGTAMFPLRAFAAAMNVSDENIVWNEKSRTIVIYTGGATISIRIGELKFNKNGVDIPMDSPAVIRDGRVMLPLRAVAQALSASVTWDDASKSVTIE